MNTVYQKDSYTLRRKSREIVHTEVVSNRFVARLSEADVAALVGDAGVRWFINAERDALEPVAEARGLWDSRVRGHVAQGEGSVGDHPQGYYFLAELWRGAGGEKIVVLQYRH